VIDLYTWTTPNGRKASIALEELGLPYTVHPIDIGKDEQFKPEFLKISPNNRIPAIVDRENGTSLMESGAILIYLADKTGKLLPKSGEGHYRVLEWLMWQMGGPGPMFGQVHHFVKYNKGRCPTRKSAISRRRIGSTACSTAGSPNTNSSPMTTPSPTSPSGHGSRATNGRL
jgi:GSH-dependent disulfide-bond oxidoreductase